MIKLTNINKSFENTSIIQDLNLTVTTGEKITIIGTSGCGKSTLLRLILGLHELDSGEIQIDNTNISNLSKREILKQYKN